MRAEAEVAPAGGLIEASRRWGPAPQAWLDLSTGVAPWSCPLPPVPAAAWQRLPGDDDAAMQALLAAARGYYRCEAPLLAVAGSVAAIRALPRVVTRWRHHAQVIAAPLAFSEHASAWAQAGHRVRIVPAHEFDAAIDSADVAIVCQPDNPACTDVEPAQLLAWRERLAARGGWLVVDEAFRDTRPERSVVGAAGAPGLVVLRSLGPFFGLAGARVGFVAGRAMLVDLLREALGPGAVNGPAQVVAAAALADTAWQAAQRERLVGSARRLAQLCQAHGLPVRHTDFFVWSDAAQALDWHHGLARQAVWTRCFTSPAGASLRLGLPGDEAGWQRLTSALQAGPQAPAGIDQGSTNDGQD